MKKPIQDRSYFKTLLKKDSLTVAKSLIGVRLGFLGPDGPVSGVINETEAYTQEDPACHAFGGKQTPRNQIMFRSAGHVYIYFIYGMYYCLNIVTEEEGRGCAVLIRGVIPDKECIEQIKFNRNCKLNSNSEKGLSDGPGKLVMALGIPSDLNGAFLFDDECPLFLERQNDLVLDVKSSSRIGISKGTDLNWRFLGQ